MYLNTVFSDTTHTASKRLPRLFQKTPAELNIQEAALMAGVVNGPSRLSPVRNPDRALRRRNLVLQQMATYNFITQQECDSISLIPIDMSKYGMSDHNTGQATYFREFLRNFLTDWANTHTKANGEKYNIYKDGLRVYTTIDSRMQQYAEDAIREHLALYLQPAFYEHWKGIPNAPFDLTDTTEINHVMELSIKRSERYRVLNNAGMSFDSIMENFKNP